ncbi:MAG: hypothetical protein DHS20C16_23780 [Phycisphaerae bacterium]|nr:MAG: hypothetical protein DHS20C16_23780 [Phycisphaerae bacterium]
MIDRLHANITGSLVTIMSLAMVASAPHRVIADESAQAPPINRIEGKVVDHAGNPVAGVQVAATNRKLGYINYNGNGSLHVYGPSKRVLLMFKARNGSASVEAVTDANGQFVLSSIMDGPVNFAAAHPEHGIAFLENIDPVKDGKPLSIKLEEPLFATGKIKGGPDQHYGAMFQQPGDQRRLGNLLPVEPGPANSINWQMMAWTGADGAFRIGPLPHHIDEWNFTFDRRAKNYSATVLQIPVTVSKLAERPIDIDLSKGHKLSGIIRGPKNEPLPDVSVTTVRSDGILVGTISDKLGKYEISGATEGTIQLEAKRWARRTAPG